MACIAISRVTIMLLIGAIDVRQYVRRRTDNLVSDSSFEMKFSPADARIYNRFLHMDVLLFDDMS